MTDIRLQEKNSIKRIEVQTEKLLGDEWIRAIIDQDFESLTKICYPDIKSTLLLPRRIAQLDHVTDLIKEVDGWFGGYDLIQKEQARVSMVGEKLGIFYRLRCKDSTRANTIEQQLYCTVRDGRIEQVRLVCSGFQPDHISDSTAPASDVTSSTVNIQSSSPGVPRTNALLEYKAGVEQGSTCASLTPSIKSKLRELSSGEVLEVHVDDITAKEDIEAWSRLSGNSILKMDQTADQELVFYIQKK